MKREGRKEGRKDNREKHKISFSVNGEQVSKTRVAKVVIDVGGNHQQLPGVKDPPGLHGGEGKVYNTKRKVKTKWRNRREKTGVNHTATGECPVVLVGACPDQVDLDVALFPAVGNGCGVRGVGGGEVNAAIVVNALLGIANTASLCIPGDVINVACDKRARRREKGIWSHSKRG